MRAAYARLRDTHHCDFENVHAAYAPCPKLCCAMTLASKMPTQHNIYRHIMNVKNMARWKTFDTAYERLARRQEYMSPGSFRQDHLDSGHRDG